MYFSLKNILLIVALGLCSIIQAQIYAPSADKDQLTIYKNSITNKSDTIYIFARENVNKSIVAHLPDSANADFEWSLFTGSGYAVFKTDLNSSFSVVDGITASGGYKVTINDTSNYYCWVIIQYFEVDITSTIDGDTIPNGDINCRTISYIKAEIIDEDHYYYNPDPPYLDPYLYKPAYKIAWSSYPKEAQVPQPVYSLQVSVEDPYWENTAYIITVTDNDINQSKDDSAFYKSVRPHAEFDPPFPIKLDNETYYPGKQEWYYMNAYDSVTYDKTSAPARFLFNNKLSKNADAFTWIFGDSITAQSGADTVLEHKYELPGTYFAYLIAKKNVDFLYDPCYDTFPKSGSDEEIQEFNKIDVTQAYFDTAQVPNVLTPNYDYWRFKGDVSLTDLEIAIFNRFGKRVYHYKGDFRDWPGWDGTNNGNKVNTGVYFYVVKQLKALPDFETENLPEGLILIKKGFIHVYQ